MTCKISRLRELRGMSQAQLAEKCNVTQQNISKIERGAGEPSYSLATKIAKALQCTIDDLYEKEAI